MDLLEESIVPEHARDVKQEAREFAEKHIEPNAEEYFDRGEYPEEIVKKGEEAGLVGQSISEEYGGRGFSIYEQLAIAEEFYKADAGLGLSLQLPGFGTTIVEEHGTEEQKEEYLRPVAENEMRSGLGVSEPETGSDMAGMQTTAEKDTPEQSSASPGSTEATQDGDEWVLNGEKYWVGNGVEADWLTIYARTGHDEDNRYGNFSLFIVPTDAPGYHAEHIPEKMCYRASKQAHITFDDCRIPEENLVGNEGAGFYVMADFFNHGRAVVAGHGLGLAAAAIEEASAFVHDREAFGRTIDNFQSVQHDLAEMRMEFESARALSWRAVEKVANGDRPGYWAALAKTTATEAATECAERGMQLHGGRSVLNENRISRVYRDVRVPVIYEGANPIQRNLIYSQAPR
ncbi:acyl-CoA dehydrogenase family protein [Halovenus sp. HT40]|uniref:acyl-CoA dehydrogenase family protein n=1 Tax=Halovenus sp. HT40 TaxID=3126691 RepID=UPI00300F6CF8